MHWKKCSAHVLGRNPASLFSGKAQAGEDPLTRAAANAETPALARFLGQKWLETRAKWRSAVLYAAQCVA